MTDLTGGLRAPTTQKDMDKRTFMKKFAIWTAVVVAVVMLIIGLCFGKVIEETLFGEIAKWVVGTIGLICIFEVFAYTIGQVAYDIFIRPKNGDYE